MDEEGNTPLHTAAESTVLGINPPDINVIEVLVRAGANLNAKNKSRMTAVQIAQQKHPEWFNQNQTRFQQILNSISP